jgi:glutathione S-transferase
MTLVLHGAWRSSAAYRVRIGLNLKGLAYETAPVNLVDNQHQAPPSPRSIRRSWSLPWWSTARR